MPVLGQSIFSDPEGQSRETPRPRNFFEALNNLDDRSLPATRADIDALREEIRQLGTDLAVRQSALILGVEARREYGRIVLEQVLRRGGKG